MQYVVNFTSMQYMSTPALRACYRL